MKDKGVHIIVMNKQEELKNQLMIIKENGWELPDNINTYDLSLKMLHNIGSIDPILRDSLIFNMFQRIILNEQISHKQMKEVLDLCLSENHLFYGIGKTDDDSVFTRTFTLCVIESILNVNNKSQINFLDKIEILNTFKKIIEYSRKEKDFRGYVNIKGWAHSTAHTSDVLCCLAESKFINYKELIEILNLIKDKIFINTYTYINEEDERLINAFVSIYNRHIIKDEEIISWIYSFNDVEESGQCENQEHLRENRKVFLRSLFFRIRKLNLNKKFLPAIEETLDNLPAFF